MEKELEQKLNEITVRQDLLFSVISNEYLAQQAMQVYSSVMKGVEAEPENKQLKEVAEKSIQSYKFHGENVNDAISYYYDIFGEEANLGVFDIMKVRGVDRDTPETKEPEPISQIKSVGKRTSEKV